VLLFVLSQVLFLVNIQFPKGHSFDEFHYVPSAKQFLKLTENQNWEHPPLAKLLIAVGIKTWGDRPIGWRFMSALFGSLTLVGMYLWALALFRDRRTALFAAILTAANNMLYVQARIGMLDTFMFAFVVFGLAALTAAWNGSNTPRRTFQYCLAAGVMFGLGAACKWTAIVPWFTAIAMIAALKSLQAWNMECRGGSPWQSRHPGFEDWYSPKLFGGVGVPHLVLALGVVPLLVYFLAFTPYLFVHKADQSTYSVLDFFAMQARMLDGQQRVVTAHPYMSDWKGWPLMLRPIWYAFDKEGGEYVRGVLMIGNPLIMWSGLLAMIACVWSWFARRSREAFLIVTFFFAFYLCWAVIPRKIAFYYYYYPAGMTLSMAIATVFHYIEAEWAELKRQCAWLRWTFLGASVAMFLYFFPILAALRIPADTFRQWMWFKSWI
jgi:dolichyl-phosphate-mannose--protein O-mannosyl transferase